MRTAKQNPLKTSDLDIEQPSINLFGINFQIIDENEEYQDAATNAVAMKFMEKVFAEWKKANKWEA